MNKAAVLSLSGLCVLCLLALRYPESESNPAHAEVALSPGPVHAPAGGDPNIDVRVAAVRPRVAVRRHAAPATIATTRENPVVRSGGLPRTDITGEQRLVLALPNGESMGVTFAEHSASSSGAINWTGRIDGDPESFFSLSMVGDAVEGYTLAEQGEYQLTGRQGGELKVEPLNLPHDFCGTCQAMQVGPAGYGDAFHEPIDPTPVFLAVGDPVVDVLVVYTPLALQAAGTLDALLAKANQMINSLNNLMSSSGADATANLIGIAPVSHPAASATSDGSVSTLFSRLQNSADGQLDEAHGYRDAYGADLVCVFGKATGFGIASIGGVWSAADYQTAHGVMPHELGHNLGCGHNDVPGSGQTYLPGIYSYSFGHFFDYGGEQRGTIMSYVGRRMTRFSNPARTWNGVVTGTATRDHARTISTFAPTAAGWKTSDPLDYDHDGIPNTEESGSADADGDGLPDILDPDNAPREDVSVIAGWDHWVAAGRDTFHPTHLEAGFTGVAVGLPEAGGSWFNFSNGTVANGASGDGTWGTLADPAADATTDTSTDGVTLSNGYDGWMDFSVTNMTGTAVTMAGFHFDSGAFRASAATDWSLDVLPGGGLTPINGFAGGTTTVAPAPMTDDWDIDLSGLPDALLEAGESVTFRLNWTGGTAPPSAGGHHLFLDNVAISIVAIAVGDPITEFSPSPSSPGDLLLSWSSRVGRVYGVASASVPGADEDPAWRVIPGLSNLVADSDATTVTTTVGVAEAMLYRVEEVQSASPHQ